MIMQNNTVLTTVQKKKLLITQGAMFRLGLTESAHALRTHLQPDVLAKSAMDSIVSTVSSALGHGFNLRSLSDANLQTILPIAISAVSLLVKRRTLIKPVLIGALALGVGSAIARFASEKKHQKQHRVASPNS